MQAKERERGGVSSCLHLPAPPPSAYPDPFQPTPTPESSPESPQAGISNADGRLAPPLFCSPGGSWVKGQSSGVRMPGCKVWLYHCQLSEPGKATSPPRASAPPCKMGVIHPPQWAVLDTLILDYRVKTLHRGGGILIIKPLLCASHRSSFLDFIALDPHSNTTKWVLLHTFSHENQGLERVNGFCEAVRADL